MYAYSAKCKVHPSTAKVHDICRKVQAVRIQLRVYGFTQALQKYVTFVGKCNVYAYSAKCKVYPSTAKVHDICWKVQGVRIQRIV